MQQKEFEIVSIIASRKAEFYVNTRNRLLDSLPPSVDRSEARLRLRRAIAELDNTLFIGKEERASNIIRAGLAVKQLNLDVQAILDLILEAMTKTEDIDH